jgi:hypothetical protein
MGNAKQFDSLSTSYVNLAALIRYLREQDFAGSIHVTLDQYEADVYLNGQDAPTVLEIDSSTRQASQNDGAMERLMVHAREPGGTITVCEDESAPPVKSVADGASSSANPVDDGEVTETKPPAEEVDWEALVRASGELIAAVERAVQSIESDFAADFRSARVELGDDYLFLDPTAGGLEYSGGVVTLNERPSAGAYVTGLSECLRRVVSKLAVDQQAARFRERVAVEMAVTARLRANAMGEFTTHLDRIAGTRVL